MPHPSTVLQAVRSKSVDHPLFCPGAGVIARIIGASVNDTKRALNSLASAGQLEVIDHPGIRGLRYRVVERPTTDTPPAPPRPVTDTPPAPPRPVTDTAPSYEMWLPNGAPNPAHPDYDLIMENS